MSVRVCTYVYVCTCVCVTHTVQQARQMARVETPEDMKRRKKLEAEQKMQQEAQEKQDSARESVSCRRWLPAPGTVPSLARVCVRMCACVVPLGRRL